MTMVAGWAGSWQAAQDSAWAKQAYPVCISFQAPASQKEAVSSQKALTWHHSVLGDWRPIPALAQPKDGTPTTWPALCSPPSSGPPGTANHLSAAFLNVLQP